jgi:pimeloyl-ACP methyl ester carboxylesterase
MRPQPPRRSTHASGAPQSPIRFDRWGGGGRPVLLLHGLLFDRTMWWPVAAELAGVDCSVIAPDLPGHGESPGRDDHRPERVAADLAALVHGLGLRRAPLVVGHATSAWLAAAFADAYAIHHLLTVDEPVGAPAADLDAVLAIADPAAVPAAYRPFAQARRDPALLRSYASWWAGPPARRTVPAGPGGSASPIAEGAFRHLTDPAGFAAEVRALL